MWLMRAGLATLALGQLVPGVWALAAPAHFYRRFPGVGAGWVVADGPFNHHLVVDAGAGFAATGAALLLAAVWPSKRVRIVALVAYLTHAVPHLIYHARHVPVSLSPTEQALTWGPLAAGIMLALGLLTAGGPARRPASPASFPASQAGQRIPGIQGWPRNPLLLIVFAIGRRHLGAVPDSWRVTARVPRVALARAAGDAAHQRTKLVHPRLGALANLRAATLVECAFCIDIHSAFAPALGVRREQVLHLRSWRKADVFDDDERLALELADAMTATPVEVSDELARALIDRFGPEGLIELATTVGHENARARANRAIGVSAQGFAAAAACPLPGPAS